MEEEFLKPYLDYEAVWEQELKTIERKLAATTAETEKDDGDESMCPCDPASLVSMATSSNTGESVDELKALVVAFTDEHNETMTMLPKRTCL